MPSLPVLPEYLAYNPDGRFCHRTNGDSVRVGFTSLSAILPECDFFFFACMGQLPTWFHVPTVGPAILPVLPPRNDECSDETSDHSLPKPMPPAPASIVIRSIPNIPLQIASPGSPAAILSVPSITFNGDHIKPDISCVTDTIGSSA